AADPGREPEQRRRERAVVVRVVDVRQVAVRGARRGDEVVPRVAGERAPRVPGHRREHDAEHGDRGERDEGGVERERALASGTSAGGGRRHEAALLSCPGSCSSSPATTRSATPMTAWPLTISG